MIIRLFLGINLYAIMINFLKDLNLGMGSFDSVTLEIQKIFHITEFGNASFILHFIFFIALIILHKKYKIKIKFLAISILSIFFLTRIVNLYGLLGIHFEPTIFNSIWIILLLNLGLYLIASTNLIIAPFDKFVVESSNYSNIALGKVRLIADCALLILTVVINIFLVDKISISLYTVIITFATGINIHLYDIAFKRFGILKQ